MPHVNDGQMKWLLVQLDKRIQTAQMKTEANLSKMVAKELSKVRQMPNIGSSHVCRDETRDSSNGVFAMLALLSPTAFCSLVVVRSLPCTEGQFLST